MGKTLVTLIILSYLLGGCGDDIQGNLRLLLAPIHDGRGQTQDPYVLVDRVELGLVDEWAVFHPLGTAAPKSKFGPGLVGGGKKGAPYIIGLNTRDRPVAQGFGPYLSLVKGIDSTLTVPFYELNTTVAARIHAQERVSEPFTGKAPTMFIDHRHTESSSISSGQNDLSAVITLLWQGQDLLIQIRVRDDQVTLAEQGSAITEGDAVSVYLEDKIVTVNSDSRIDPSDGATNISAGVVSGGYLISMVMPLSVVGKNRGVGFDVRIYDKDGDDPVAMATWQFDGETPGDDLQPAEYGTLVLGVPLIDLLQSREAFQAFPCRDGMVEVTGGWSETDLTLTVTVPDDEVNTAGTMEGADRVEVYLDLVNNRPPVVDPARFVRIVSTAGESVTITRGNDLADLTQAFTFTGDVRATAAAESYTVAISLPWEDLELVSDPQRGWFLGLEIRVVDEDAGGPSTYSWSDSAVLDSDLFPELRLFTVE
jgi:hypothetical protein